MHKSSNECHCNDAVRTGQWRRQRSYTERWRNIETIRWLLAGILTVTICSVSRADNVTSKDDSECRRLYATHSMTVMPLTFHEDDNAELRTESSGGWRLRSYLKFHDLQPVEELNDPGWTILCVGLTDTSTFSTKRTGGEPAAWFAIETFQEVPVGFMRVGTLCWRNYKAFRDCEPTFSPLPHFANLPQYHHSTLEEDFWTKMTVEKELKQNWISRINSETTRGSVPAEWVYKMNIPSIQRLEMRGNDWRKPERILKPLPKVWRLNLADNNLEAIPDGMLLGMPFVTEIVLGGNILTKYPHDVKHLPRLGRLDLTNPRLSVLNVTLRIEDEDIENFPKTMYNFGSENSNLIANVTKMLLSPHLSFLNLGGCSLGQIKDEENIVEKSGLATIGLSNNGIKHLPLKVFSAMPNLKEILLNNNDMEEWPESILESNSLVLLVLTHNRIKNITSETFKNLGKLEILLLGWNEIQYLSEFAFKNLHHLKTLVLSHNKLTSISDSLFKYSPQLLAIHLNQNMLKHGFNLWQLQLHILDLSNNNITRFASTNTSSIIRFDLSNNNVTYIDVPPTIEKMNASHNAITYIPPEMWSKLTRLKQIDLGGNDFECCQFGNRTYLNENHRSVILNLGSKDPLTCSISQTSPKILLQTFVYNETECNNQDLETVNSFGIAVVLPLAVLLLAGTLVSVVMYVYRFELTYVKHLFKMKKIGAETDEERYKTCVYDAFVCYSAKNFEWVMRTLLPGIEGGSEGYRLCVHDRDFALCAGINRNIVASLEKSRKVVFVLSADFIASKWCQWELEMANHKMFEEKHNYIILVELERLDRRSLPRHLRYLMDRTTYLEWPEGESGVVLPLEHKELDCIRQLKKALGTSLRQRTGRDNEGFFTVLDHL